MKKKKKDGIKKKPPVKKAEEPKAESSKSDEPNEKPFDFGGLPDRDLKKNLGCG